MSGGYAPVRPDNRLVVKLSPSDHPDVLSNMVVMAGDLRVALTVRHDPDGDYLRVVVDAPYSDVTLSAQSYPVDGRKANR